MKKKRAKIPQEIVDKIMVLCKRKCCWCETNEVTEIHHIDNNPSNNEQDNLFPCCSMCQKKFHTSTSFVRKITENELKKRRDNFYSTSNFKLEILNEFKKIKPTLMGDIIR